MQVSLMTMNSNEMKKLQHLKMFQTMNLKISEHLIVMLLLRVLKLANHIMRELLTLLR